MALAALCGDDTWGSTWARVLQHRFHSEGDLDGHALGNLIITALWEETQDVVSGLDWVARLLDARGTVLPLALEPLEIVAQVRDKGIVQSIRGQIEVATAQGTIESIELHPQSPRHCQQAVDAVAQADAIVLGPGSWFTSVLTHFQVPQMNNALHATPAQRVLVLNLNSHTSETAGYSPVTYLDVLVEQQPEFRLDAVIADPDLVGDPAKLARTCENIGAYLHLAPVAQPGTEKHDPELLASAYRAVFGHGKI
jgi:uncharacterized cofD-like protein